MQPKNTGDYPQISLERKTLQKSGKFGLHAPKIHLKQSKHEYTTSDRHCQVSS